MRKDVAQVNHHTDKDDSGMPRSEAMASRRPRPKNRAHVLSALGMPGSTFHVVLLDSVKTQVKPYNCSKNLLQLNNSQRDTISIKIAASVDVSGQFKCPVTSATSSTSGYKHSLNIYHFTLGISKLLI